MMFDGRVKVPIRSGRGTRQGLGVRPRISEPRTTPPLFIEAQGAKVDRADAQGRRVKRM